MNPLRLHWTAGIVLGAGLGLGSVVTAGANQVPTMATAYGSVPLAQATLARTWLYTNPPSSLVSSGGVPFSLGNAYWLHYKDAASVTMNFDKPLAAYLLINTSWTDGAFAGQTVGTVRLTFSDGTVRDTALVVGSNIREWEYGVSWTCHTLSSPSTVSVWQGRATAYQGGAAATIDRLTIPAVSTAHLTGVTVTNTNNSHMGIVFQGLTVLYDPWHRPGHSWDTPAATRSEAPEHANSGNFTGVSPAQNDKEPAPDNG